MPGSRARTRRFVCSEAVDSYIPRGLTVRSRTSTPEITTTATASTKFRPHLEKLPASLHAPYCVLSRAQIGLTCRAGKMKVLGALMVVLMAALVSAQESK